MTFKSSFRQNSFFFPGELFDATLDKVGVSLLNFCGEATGNLSVPLQGVRSRSGSNRANAL
ncbi:hypothetical protein DPMN_146632 [Dreissena polymorpha]|uniref:Uncharacterized protein n=1 Tax=Dreissena polymorpha TaxID=45954 RepID=A0A9D4FC43_DREPO|nr:hypothetical protein DPMN_146632 [Dreissena polymorpha]